MRPIAFILILGSALLMSCSRVNFSTRQIANPTITTLGSTTSSSTLPPSTNTTVTLPPTTATTLPPTTATTLPPTTATTLPPTTATTLPPSTNTTVPPPGYVTRTKTITVNPSMTSVDILLIVDDSSSMAQDNAKLAQRLGGLVTGLQSSNLNWQMCVTTTDTGYYGGRPIVWSGYNHHVLKPNVGSNLSAVIQQTIYDIGSGYSNDEQGIYAASLSVQGNATTGCYRQSAALAVILISDEDERSVAGVYNRSSAQYKALHSGNYPANLVTTVKNKFGASKKFAFNSIIVQDAACEAAQDAQGTPSFQGTFYLNAASLTAGRTGSICDSDYYQHMNLFRIGIQNTVSSVDLDCNPYGTPTLSPNHAHSISGKKIIFNPALTDGQSVTITYRCLL